jgi:hypothetical protein
VNPRAAEATLKIANLLASSTWLDEREEGRGHVRNTHVRTMTSLQLTPNEQAAYAMGMRYAAEQFLLALNTPAATNENFASWLYLLSAVAANEALMDGLDVTEPAPETPEV